MPVRATKTKEPLPEDGLLLNEAIRKLKELGIEATPRQLRLWDSLVTPSHDGSNYRRFSYEDLDKAVFVFVLNKVLKISMDRIRSILVILKSEPELQRILETNPLAIMAKYRDADGKESWRIKRELRDDIMTLKDSLRKFQAGLERFEEVFRDAATRFHQQALQYQAKQEE